MVIHTRWRTRVRFAAGVRWAVCAFQAVGHAASPEPDRVSLIESTITWSTVKYATNAENGFVSGSLDKKTIVDRTFKTYVLENRYLKVTLVPEFGGRILSIIYKPTGHEQLYRTEVGVPYGIEGGIFYYDWLMVYGGIFPTFSDPEHGRTWVKPWDLKVVKQSAGEVTVSMSLKDDFEYSAAPRKFRGSTGIEATYYVPLKPVRAAPIGRRCLKIRTTRRFNTSTGRARRWRRDRTRKIPGPPAAPKSLHRSRPTAHRTGRAICPTATRAWGRARAVSRNCATSRTGRRWASRMRRPICRVVISGA